jgi:hypothetical protein
VPQRSFLFSASLAESPQPSRRAFSGDRNRAGVHLRCSLTAIRASRLRQIIGNSTQTSLNCREDDISILRQGLAPDHGQRFLERIAPILSRSCPASLFVLDDPINSSRSRPAILGRMGWDDFDGMRTFRFPCIRDCLGRIPRRLHCRLTPVRRDKSKCFLAAKARRTRSRSRKTN